MPCVCLRGYLRNQWGECISREECNMCSDRHNEEYRSCGPTCELVCDQPPPGSIGREPCVYRCNAGCFCVPGFIRHEEGGACVPISRCPPRCGEDATYSRCAHNCPTVCNQTMARACDRDLCLNEGCDCDSGYLLSLDETQCVPEELCPHTVY
ncbi:serine protease inhibitor swm-1-like [Ornithodoros turicata]|uniref:serine protease inhibitor swm-1-like n=1 Tax=Ornithodoros turicata TaxID=34597 RepID=UPI003139AF2D